MSHDWSNWFIEVSSQHNSVHERLRLCYLFFKPPCCSLTSSVWSSSVLCYDVSAFWGCTRTCVCVCWRVSDATEPAAELCYTIWLLSVCSVSVVSSVFSLLLFWLLSVKCVVWACVAFLTVCTCHPSVSFFRVRHLTENLCRAHTHTCRIKIHTELHFQSYSSLPQGLSVYVCT